MSRLAGASMATECREQNVPRKVLVIVLAESTDWGKFVINSDASRFKQATCAVGRAGKAANVVRQTSDCQARLAQLTRKVAKSLHLSCENEANFGKRHVVSCVIPVNEWTAVCVSWALSTRRG